MLFSTWDGCIIPDDKLCVELNIVDYTMVPAELRYMKKSFPQVVRILGLVDRFPNWHAW